MGKSVEQKLSWFTILMTAFYSLLASCRGEECGHEYLARCAVPLGKITNNNELGFVTTKHELEALCPDLRAGMTCIKLYTLRCMEGKQRENFNSLYKGVNMAIIELCHDGPYQETFLKHAPCMQKVQPEYDLCSRKYQQTVFSLESNETTSSQPIKSLCCAFQEYLECSHHAVRRKCGDDTAEFTTNFLNQMANSLIQMHCAPYTKDQCAIGAGASGLVASCLFVPVVAFIARYFT